MSLLIKALDKAQEGKVKQTQAEAVKEEQAKKRTKASKADPVEAGSGLSLSPPEAQLLEDSSINASSILESAAVTAQKEISIKAADKPAQKPSYKPILSSTKQAAERTESLAASATQTQAANVFSAKRIEATNQNAKLAIIGGAGLIALLAMGLYYYQFVDSTPDVQMPIRPPQIIASPEPTPAPPPTEVVANAVPKIPPAPEVEVSPAPDTTQAFEPRESAKQTKKTKKMQIADDEAVDAESAPEASLSANEEVVETPSKKPSKSNMVKMDKAIASESASIQVTQSKPQDAVNPLVMRAYEAYNLGKDDEAQRLYKQALQRDVLNVDALLGLAAIATRQGRSADASGWYRKVLELDPKNSTARAAMLDLQQQGDPQTGESRIKSMLAKSPNDANLHVALGNLYAEHNQWSAAQQAYFDAFRLNESADNAFNLAVSLDQMGKSKLALPYYQQALQMAQQSSTNIDKAALEARIAAIQ